MSSPWRDSDIGYRCEKTDFVYPSMATEQKRLVADKLFVAGIVDAVPAKETWKSTEKFP